MSHKKQSPDLWDTVASSYDGLRPDQGLTDPNVRAAWTELLTNTLPSPPTTILDVGCGTGTLTLLLQDMGHDASGIDFSPKMIAEATKKAKASGAKPSFSVGDGSRPDFGAASFNAIVCRQVLWALPDTTTALTNWANLLKPGGILLLVEGLFASGNGMSASDIIAAMPETLTNIKTQDLAPQTNLWGGPIPDQRYLLTAHRQ